MNNDDPAEGGTSVPLMDHWYDFAIWMLERTEKFPRSVRFTISSRVDNLLLDGIELIVQARYERENTIHLRSFNIILEKLRFFLRLAYSRKHMSSGSYRIASEKLVEAGRMTGGWIRFSLEGISEV